MPHPGNPLADHLDTCAHRLDRLAETLHRTADATTWTGTAADTFRHALAQRLTRLRDAATRLHHAADHLRRDPPPADHHGLPSPGALLALAHRGITDLAHLTDPST